ncbi:MAG: reverse transcriptase domain-containing protein [Clostridia bacterium]|nr:reverse transcriptase domain-containing protein [Clostridia bacterium]
MKFYRTSMNFIIPLKYRKKSGGKRCISEPKLKLKRLQEILKIEFFYPRKYLIHNCAYAYIPGMSMQGCIEKHTGKKLVVKMDIKNFFGSITDKFVFESMKYTFCMDDETANTVTQLCTLDGALPQGAVTSPIYQTMYAEC